MSDAWKDGADEELTRFIAEHLDEQMPMVRDWVLVATYVDDDGEDATAFNSHPNSRRTTTLGMLTYALEVEKANILREALP